MLKEIWNTWDNNMKISERGQITIPKRLREQMGLHHNVEIDITLTKEGLLIQKRSASRHPVERVYGILRNPSSTDEYIEEIRGR